MNQKNLAVQFVATPFLPEHQPALGVSSLLAVLRNRGIAADLRYLNIEYGKEIGWNLYRFIANALPVELLIGDLLFAPALWGDTAPSFESFLGKLGYLRESGSIVAPTCSGYVLGQLTQFLDRITPSQDSGPARQFPDLDSLLIKLRRLHDDSPRIVAQWAGQILHTRPRIVGFTSTFQQNIASLALARELRRRAPPEELRIVFGGANCEADMGRAIAENFPFVDHVVSGEAEEIIVDVVQRIVEGSAVQLPRFIKGAMVRDMNALPEPDFASYFAAVAGTPWSTAANLVAESSRGCWWGMKAHCTFCGLNGTTMTYRSKEPARFARELSNLKRTYGPGAFMLADNIMEMKYLNSLFPELAASDETIELFYETKANLRKEQLIAMAAGGVVRIQPGIESLSTPVLKLMDKGTTRLQNMQLLKWSEELKIGLAWNFLFGFPGEPAEEYAEMTRLIPQLWHLPAPTGTSMVRLDRFSPYWRAPEMHGVTNLRPFWSYDHVYASLSPEARMRIAYFFEYDHADGRNPRIYAADTAAAIAQWRSAYNERHATLEIITEDAQAFVIDTRAVDESRRCRLSGSEAALLKVLDAAVHRDAIASKLEKISPSRGIISELEIAEMLDRFLRSGWVVRENDLLLSIVLDRTERNRVVNRRVDLRLAQFGLAEQHRSVHTGDVIA